MAIELGQVQKAQYEQLLSSGTLYAVLGSSGELERRAGGGKRKEGSPPSTAGTQGCQKTFSQGGITNIRMNQDCSLRRQAEEVIAVNPRNPQNLIGGQNDSRLGFNHCGYAWSFDGSKTWGDQTPPFYQFVLADGHTADACSDPTATFDFDGNAYVGGVLFDVGSFASAFVVAKSNAGIGGAFCHTPAALSFQTLRTVPLGVVASDNNPDIFHDKEFIVADQGENSPKRNNVYATWTRFNFATGAGVGVDSPIFFSQSSDGGATWSLGVEISGASGACTVFSGSANPNACDQDQGSHPVVGKDGTLCVTFGNGNTPLPGVNQVLFVKCPGSADCTNPANWSAPVKVGDLIDNHPTGPSPEGCPAGRQRLPPNGYRVPEFTSISVSVDLDNRLYVVWSDFRNGGPPCDTGNAATSTPPCNNDVFYAFSTDGGATWSDTRNITPQREFGKTAQWQPWSAVAPKGNRLWVAYYDRSYGDCETTGCNDITLVRVRNPASNSPAFQYRRITTSSMPNLTLANNPLQAGFLGDYMWVAVDPSGRPHVVWADTHGRGGDSVEEDIYFFKGKENEER
ncbi:MAG: exo-alpha-sialidase [Chloroflexi bacterium]|nr:exo-alpha-sialidase [Chloroflexota bacterium]